MSHPVSRPYACVGIIAGMSTLERIEAFDNGARDLIVGYNAFKIKRFDYDFPAQLNI